MKIAIASDGGQVAGHFGHCERFRIYEIEGNSIVSETEIVNPEHKPGFLPVFLQSHGVEVVVAGGMGQRAQDIFRLKGVKVYAGVSGTLDDVLASYLAGTLVGTGAVCQHHGHHEHGPGHGGCGQHQS